MTAFFEIALSGFWPFVGACILLLVFSFVVHCVASDLAEAINKLRRGD